MENNENSDTWLQKVAGAMTEMTSRYLEFKIDATRSIIIETADPGTQGRAGPVGVGKVIERAKLNFHEIVSRIPEIIGPIYAELVENIPRAEEMRVEFGFKVSGELGIIVAKSQAESNFKITFVWKGKSAEP